MSHSAFSVFAASHYVPITAVMRNKTDTRDITASTNTRQGKCIKHLTIIHFYLHDMH